MSVFEGTPFLVALKKHRFWGPQNSHLAYITSMRLVFFGHTLVLVLQRKAKGSYATWRLREIHSTI